MEQQCETVQIGLSYIVSFKVARFDFQWEWVRSPPRPIDSSCTTTRSRREHGLYPKQRIQKRNIQTKSIREGVGILLFQKWLADRLPFPTPRNS